MSKLGIPFVADIPIQQEQEMNDEVDLEIALEKKKDERIEKTFINPTSNLRRIGDYLYTNLNKEISYKQIAKDLDISEGNIKICVCELNYYKKFPITMIPVPKKAGYIQSVLKNDEDYEKWDLKKTKTITTMKAVKGKARKITSSKKKVRIQEKVKIEQENKQ